MRNILIAVILFFITLNTNAQKIDKEKMKALKIAFITEKLSLTEKEAQNFWPVYNIYQSKIEALKTESAEIRKLTSPSFNHTLTEDEVKKNIYKVIEIGNKKNIHFKNYISDLLKFLPPKKVVIVTTIEKEFRQKIVEEYKKRMEQYKD